MNLLTVGLVSIFGVFIMGGPDPSSDPGNSGVVFNQNHETGFAEWKFGEENNPDCEVCIASGDTRYADVVLSVNTGVVTSVPIATKDHKFTLANGDYTITLLVDVQSIDEVNGVPAYAVIASPGYHSNGTIWATTDEVVNITRGQYERLSIELPFVINSEVLNDSKFGVCFRVSLFNDAGASVRVDRIGVVPTKVE